MKGILFLLAFALPMAFGFTPPSQPLQDVTYDAPTNVQKTSSSSGSISFAWDASFQAVQYKMYYVKRGSSASSYFYTTNTNYTFSGLPAGEYYFYFAAVYDGGVSPWIVIEDQIM
ncbi:MAG: fibronectin type III domain-containing protein [Saprospiraceae bacterium]|nr:fibronectin type III domain-containing protein [Saprospiraceae bacterium]